MHAAPEFQEHRYPSAAGRTVLWSRRSLEPWPLGGRAL